MRRVFPVGAARVKQVATKMRAVGKECLRSADYTDYADSRRLWLTIAGKTFDSETPSALARRNSLNLRNLRKSVDHFFFGIWV
jgi:hypothetical protein